jgi:hypothetical protein
MKSKGIGYMAKLPPPPKPIKKEINPQAETAKPASPHE